MLEVPNTAPLNTVGCNVYTVDDIMAMHKVCRNTVYNYIKKYGWKTYKWGRDIRIDKNSFDEWLEQQSNTKGE